MTERKGIQIPVWCSALCRNAYNEKCVEECSVNRDCSYFEEKPNLNLGDMPSFPKTADMTKEEKFISVTIYLSKVIDHLQGKESELNNMVFHGTTRVADVLKNFESKEQE